MKKININIHQKNSILYSVIYGGIILIIILVGILPYSFKVSNQEKTNEKLRMQINEQKELAPVLTTLAANSESKTALVLPHPAKAALPRLEVKKIQNDFQNAAQKSGLKIVSFTPDINTSASPSTSFAHHIVLKGELSDLRKMLIAIGALPYLEKIEEIHIQQNTGSMDFTMKVWTAIQ